MRLASLLVTSALLAAACDSSSTSSSSGGFTYDGGTYTAPEAGTPPTDAGGSPDGSTGTPDGGGTGGCTLTLSGGVSKSVSCNVAAAWDSGNNTGGLTITTAANDVQFALKIDGEPMATTYTWSNSANQGGAVTENSGVLTAWVVDQSSMKGSSTVVLTSVAVSATAGTGKVYAVHGSVTATLVEQTSNNKGDVTMNVTF